MSRLVSVAAMTWAWKQTLDPTDKFILVALADHANDEDFTCWPSLRHLERKTGFARPTIWKAIDRLTKLGAVLRVGESPAGSTKYQVLVGNEITLGSEVTQVTKLPGVGNVGNKLGNQGNKLGNVVTPNHQEPSVTITEPSCDEFDSLWPAYPEREGDNPKKQALKAWNARRREGHTDIEIRQGVERYRVYCQTRGEIGTPFVMQAKRFFGPDKPFLNSWQVQSRKPAKPKTVDDYRQNIMGKTHEQPDAIDSTAKRLD